MKLLVNALSITNQSGRNVLVAQLNQLKHWFADQLDCTILYHQSNQDLIAQIPGMNWRRCPGYTSHWLGRAVWERANIDSMAVSIGCDVIYCVSGMTLPTQVPQLVLCMNPWAMIPGVPQGFKQQIKASLQRKQYRNAIARADAMVFLSDYIRQAYQENANAQAERDCVSYAPIDPAVIERAASIGKRNRERNHIVSVSAMARHKNPHVLVKALKQIRQQRIDARLTLAGGWPDPQYRRDVVELIDSLQLTEHVSLTGWVDDNQLAELYQRADVFCLLSSSESFGIPAIEAQCYGTPCVGTDACAVPEVCGEGGVYVPVNDSQAAADQLSRLLTDQAHWHSLHQAALRNVQRFRCDVACRSLAHALMRFDSRLQSPLGPQQQTDNALIFHRAGTLSTFASQSSGVMQN